MKKLKLSFIVLFASLSLIGMRAESATSEIQNELVVVYNGTTIEFQFEFINENGETVLFDYIKSDVTANLYNDENIGAKYKVSWIEQAEKEYDKDGKPTGKIIIKKMIVDLTKI
jgi:hypothetical protein